MEEDRSLVRFYIPSEAKWSNISSQTSAVGEYLTTAARAIARENDKLSGVVETVDFNATAGGSRIVNEEDSLH